MDLPSAISELSKRKRAEILELAKRNRGNSSSLSGAKEGRAFFVGYDKDGYAIVTQDGVEKKARVVGSITIKKGEMVFIDATGSIEVKTKKKEEVSEKEKTAKKKASGKITQKLSPSLALNRPLVEDEDEQFHLYISIIDEDDGYSAAQKQADWNAWVERRKEVRQNHFLIVLRPLPTNGSFSVPSGFTGQVIGVTRPGEGGGSTNYSRILKEYFDRGVQEVRLSIDTSGSMTFSTVSSDVAAFQDFVSSRKIKYTQALVSNENWIGYHINI